MLGVGGRQGKCNPEAAVALHISQVCICDPQRRQRFLKRLQLSSIVQANHKDGLQRMQNCEISP